MSRLDEDRILRFLLDLRGCPTVRPPTLGLVSLLILSVNKLGRYCRSLLLPARLQVISDHIEANLLSSSDEIRLQVMTRVLHLLATMSEWQGRCLCRGITDFQSFPWLPSICSWQMYRQPSSVSTTPPP